MLLDRRAEKARARFDRRQRPHPEAKLADVYRVRRALSPVAVGSRRKAICRLADTVIMFDLY
jgi:hypothetical protein